MEYDPSLPHVGYLEGRNAHIFKGNERPIHDLKLSFFHTLFEWANASGVSTFNSLPDLPDFYTSTAI